MLCLQGISTRTGKRDTLDPGEEDHAAEGGREDTGIAAAGTRSSQAEAPEDPQGDSLTGNTCKAGKREKAAV